MSEEDQNTSVEKSISKDAVEIEEEAPKYVGRSLLSKEEQSSIFEILKCAVCLEIPKGKPNLQVKTCEMGHHFCMSCHKKLKTCAICRGRLFHGRNFAVEELLSKLGTVLGVSKIPLPDPLPTPQIRRGFFTCPHNCGLQTTAMYMLPHIRSKHNNKLADNLRSNPFTGRLEWMLRVVYKANGVTAQSLQVSDMGLMTIKIEFINKKVRGRVHTISQGDNVFKYRMTLFHANSDISFHGGYVLGLDAPSDSPSFEAPPSLLPALDSHLDFYVYVWRAEQEGSAATDFPLSTFIPEEPVVFQNDRKSRRNKKRNMRKSKIREKRRKIQEENKVTLLAAVQDMRDLTAKMLGNFNLT